MTDKLNGTEVFFTLSQSFYQLFRERVLWDLTATQIAHYSRLSRNDEI
jgi:hypothetical protein